jgi:hypothetical protein
MVPKEYCVQSKDSAKFFGDTTKNFEYEFWNAIDFRAANLLARMSTNDSYTFDINRFIFFSFLHCLASR